MKFYLILIVSLVYNISLFAQNDAVDQNYSKFSYEQKIAEKACLCVSEKVDVKDPRQTIIDCTIYAKNMVHDEDLEGEYKRDFTVEGIRKVQYDVIQILIKECDAVIIENE